MNINDLQKQFHERFKEKVFISGEELRDFIREYFGIGCDDDWSLDEKIVDYSEICNFGGKE